MNLTKALKSTEGRFSTLTTVKNGKARSYCATIKGVSDQTVAFEDVNTGFSHREKLDKVAFLRSGEVVYRKSR